MQVKRANWSQAPYWAKYWTVDADGQSHWWEQMPLQGVSRWCLPWKGTRTEAGNKVDLPTPMDWSETLEDRPQTDSKLPEPDWDCAPAWAKYFAVDQGGRARWFKTKPQPGACIWVTDLESPWVLCKFYSSSEAKNYWYRSLVERPQTESAKINHFPPVVWENGPDWARYFAVDYDGTGKWYEDMPHRGSISWFSVVGRYATAHIGRTEVAKAHWADSLQNRPDAAAKPAEEIGKARKDAYQHLIVQEKIERLERQNAAQQGTLRLAESLFKAEIERLQAENRELRGHNTSLSSEIDLERGHVADLKHQLAASERELKEARRSSVVVAGEGYYQKLAAKRLELVESVDADKKLLEQKLATKNAAIHALQQEKLLLEGMVQNRNDKIREQDTLINAVKRQRIDVQGLNEQIADLTNGQAEWKRRAENAAVTISKLQDAVDQYGAKLAVMRGDLAEAKEMAAKWEKSHAHQQRLASERSQEISNLQRELVNLNRAYAKQQEQMASEDDLRVILHKGPDGVIQETMTLRLVRDFKRMGFSKK